MKKLLLSLVMCSVCFGAQAQTNTNTYGLIAIRSDGTPFVVPFSLTAQFIAEPVITNAVPATNLFGPFTYLNLTGGKYPLAFFSMKSNKYFLIIDKNLQMHADGSHVTNINGANIIAGTVGDIQGTKTNMFTTNNVFSGITVSDNQNTNDDVALSFIIPDHQVGPAFKLTFTNGYSLTINKGIGIGVDDPGYGNIIVSNGITSRSITNDTMANDDVSLAITARTGQTNAPFTVTGTNGIKTYIGLRGQLYVGAGTTFKSNSLSLWPTAPSSGGEIYFGNSNGWLYSLNGNIAGSAWTKTNLISAP